MSDYTEKNSNLIPKIDIPCFAWNSQAEQGLLFFKAKSLDAKGKKVTSGNQKIKWTTSNKKVATISKSGKITAKKAGTVKITAKTADGKKVTFKVKVK